MIEVIGHVFSVQDDQPVAKESIFNHQIDFATRSTCHGPQTKDENSRYNPAFDLMLNPIKTVSQNGQGNQFTCNPEFGGCQS
jgi:hypothetical protein